MLQAVEITVGLVLQSCGTDSAVKSISLPAALCITAQEPKPWRDLASPRRDLHWHVACSHLGVKRAHKMSESNCR